MSNYCLMIMTSILLLLLQCIVFFSISLGVNAFQSAVISATHINRMPKNENYVYVGALQQSSSSELVEVGGGKYLDDEQVCYLCGRYTSNLLYCLNASPNATQFVLPSHPSYVSLLTAGIL